jgi:hypothetical protein
VAWTFDPTVTFRARPDSVRADRSFPPARRASHPCPSPTPRASRVTASGSRRTTRQGGSRSSPGRYPRWVSSSTAPRGSRESSGCWGGPATEAASSSFAAPTAHSPSSPHPPTSWYGTIRLRPRPSWIRRLPSEESDVARRAAHRAVRPELEETPDVLSEETEIDRCGVRVPATLVGCYGGRAPFPRWIAFGGVSCMGRHHPQLVRFSRALAAIAGIVLFGGYCSGSPRKAGASRSSSPKPAAARSRSSTPVARWPKSRFPRDSHGTVSPHLPLPRRFR